MTLIEINHLTKDYGSERGIFDINLSIEKGQSFGFVGTNGAGKSTTIRHLMGFLKPQKGADEVFGGYLYFHKAPTPQAFHEET
ncbi:ATP-binding cassette domain-containing protein, partial [Enterococcus sp. 2201sp1_2201st1_B8_2201SCRN_220225]|uniref:ATP-binding cassette domain-containing protein n=1 Tax=Enterococcus sp. 2201sp1_2201st1_B8_2201SCRN_220225 TaxID=3141592 RepID=UPI0034A4992F